MPASKEPLVLNGCCSNSVTQTAEKVVAVRQTLTTDWSGWICLRSPLKNLTTTFFPSAEISLRVLLGKKISLAPVLWRYQKHVTVTVGGVTSMIWGTLTSRLSPFYRPRKLSPGSRYRLLCVAWELWSATRRHSTRRDWGSFSLIL